MNDRILAIEARLKALEDRLNASEPTPKAAPEVKVKKAEKK